ncbi:DUF4236 domain-containing protein [Chitinophaga sp.]|uniref:DUF4236 domain-containing protein n=1 Tax=Chitinophaga sp. TaxID=1869181 RepID=UPI002F92F7D1
MSWSYRKRIKIIPGVHLNFSKSGISTSIGIKGASLTFSNKGTYLNTSIPGLGISNRQKISNNSKPQYPSPNQGTDEEDIRPNSPSSNLADNIFSLDPQEITSQDMQGVKEAILLSRKQRIDLAHDLNDVKKTLLTTQRKLVLSYIFLYGIIKSSISQNIKNDILEQKSAINLIAEQIDKSAIELDYEFDEDILNRYNNVSGSFEKLCLSDKIWDVTSAHNQNRVVTRSAASTIVIKREVRFSNKSIPDIKANFKPLYFKNANGSDLYFYPHFIIMYSSEEKFAIIGLHEIELVFSPVRFVEDGKVPNDSKIIDRTWAKVNKNGTPDKRFKDNYQIPIVNYGSIRLRTTTGLNEEYEFSNYESCEAFANAFTSYQKMIKSLRQN